MNAVRSTPLITRLLTAATAVVASAAEVQLGKHHFQLPDGFSIQQIAGPPMVDRPICADFDEQGRLYVADSSGSNAPIEEQLKNPTHRIVRLEDTDGDGEFDKSTVFADRVMFPEGTLWHDGSLYVAAPPSIWKLTDTDDDGVYSWSTTDYSNRCQSTGVPVSPKRDRVGRLVQRDLTAGELSWDGGSPELRYHAVYRIGTRGQPNKLSVKMQPLHFILAGQSIEGEPQ
jgi:hypothetical protein